MQGALPVWPRRSQTYPQGLPHGQQLGELGAHHSRAVSSQGRAGESGGHTQVYDVCTLEIGINTTNPFRTPSFENFLEDKISVEIHEVWLCIDVPDKAKRTAWHSSCSRVECSLWDSSSTLQDSSMLATCRPARLSLRPTKKRSSVLLLCLVTRLSRTRSHKPGAADVLLLCLVTRLSRSRSHISGAVGVGFLPAPHRQPQAGLQQLGVELECVGPCCLSACRCGARSAYTARASRCGNQHVESSMWKPVCGQAGCAGRGSFSPLHAL